MTKGLVLRLEIEEGLPEIFADPVRLRQILFNLLSNAVKFSPGGGEITVTARQLRNADCTEQGAECGLRGAAATIPDNGELVEIAVQDTGIGIKPDDLDRLFQPFVRLESASGCGAEGNGLGLALTKQLVELHQGQIVAASEGEGRGSTFTVRLPSGQRG